MPSAPRTLNERVAAEVNALRGRHRLPQWRLAAVLGVAQPQLSKRLNGTVAFTTDEIEKLAAYFVVSPAQLMGYRDDDWVPDLGVTSFLAPTEGEGQAVRRQGLEPRTR